MADNKEKKEPETKSEFKPYRPGEDDEKEEKDFKPYKPEDGDDGDEGFEPLKVSETDETAEKSGNGKVIGIIIAIIVIIAVAVGIWFMVSNTQGTATKKSEVIEPAIPSDTQATMQNPIDFGALEQINEDIYGWLFVPGTKVNYGIYQHPNNDLYYLNIDATDRTVGEGAVYSQKQYNTTDFMLDPVMLLYGHTFTQKDTMFTTLHKFEDQAFFNDHKNFYIYTPGHVLTYEIVSDFEYDDRLIPKAFDFSDPAQVQDFMNACLNPDSMVKNVREGITLDAATDHIVVLSTCTEPPNDAARYLVVGKLVADTPTQGVADNAIDVINYTGDVEYEN